MKTEYYTFVDASNASGILRWIAAILLVIISIAFLIRQIKTKKSLAFITSFISTLVLVPLLIITPIHITINPGETPEPQPVDPIPHVDPEPEPVPEPDENPVEPVAPSNVTPSTKPSDNQTPSTPDEPDAPSEPEVTAKYTVIHRQQNLENDDYSIVESETQTGVVGNSVTPSTKAYTGFVAPAAKTTTVAEDGSTEIIYDYDREKIAFALGDIENTTSSLPTGEYKYGTKITLTANDRVGYVFDRWSNDATANPITIELTETTTIKPIYEANTYQIIFDKNSSVAAGSMSAQTMTYDQAKPLSKNSFVLEGYTFNHWNTESNDSGNSYTDEESVINLRTEGEITLYAFWTANTNTAYTVKHYKQNIGGGDHYTLAETDNETGTTDTIATPDRKTYTGFTAPAAQSKKITGDGEMLIEYYYVRNQYTVTFGENAGSISSDDFISGQKYYFEQSGALTADSKTGYTFVDWTDGVTDASRSFTIGAEDATIGANYRANTYAVIFHANYLNSSATASQSFTYDQTPTSLAENSFSRPGYDFDHWSVNPNDSGTGYGDKEEVQNLTSVDGGEYHLYAQWTARKYTIAFDKNADDATGSMNPQDMTYDQVADLSANQFQRASYNFKGWSTNPNATTKEYSDGEEVINLATSGTVTLYAVWEDKFPVVFSVEGDCIFNGKDGTITTSSTCQFGDTNFVGQTFVDTGISLNTSENFDKDYEISFNIDSYSPNQVEAQATFVSNKISTTHPTSQLPNPPSPLPQAKSPGVVVRKSGNNIDIRSALLNETGSGYLEANYIKPYTEFQTIKIVRHNRIVYISINGGNLFELQDVSDFNQYFNQTTWFGAYPNDGTEDPEPKNVLVGTLSNLSIRLGEMDWNYYQVEFDAKSGTLDNSYKKMQIEKGTSIETLPVTTRKKYIFDGWFIGNTQISDGYTPTEDVKIIAKWARNVQQAIASPSSFELTRGDEAYLTITNKNNIEPFTMSSSNDQIATIDQDGKVTAVSNGQAKIVLTGSRSGEIFEIPVTVTLPRYTVHFDTKGGNEIADITDVEEGSSIGTLPADPTRTGYVFDGWFLENSDTEFTTSTPITDDTNVEAHWTMDITNAIVSNISITRGESAQVNVTNANELEPFTYRSDNTNIVTVDENGNITTVAAGSTTITLVGSRSTLEATLNVSVALPKYIVHFNAHGGSDVADITGVTEGSTISVLPATTLENHVFEGWFTTETGGEELTTSTPIMGEVTYHAHWKKDVSQAAISPASLSLEVGETNQITIENESEIEQFEFATGNEDIATINGDGVVTAIAKGTTTVNIVGKQSNKVVGVAVEIYVNATLTFVPQNNESNITYNKRVDETLQESDSPEVTRDGYIFDGWFTEAENGTKIEWPYVVTGDAVLYAHWTFNTMPIVWQNPGDCIFASSKADGVYHGNVSGNTCNYTTAVTGKEFIDTGIALYNTTNINKDYEIYFEIKDYVQEASNWNDNQQTFMSEKDPTGKAPGIIIRRSSSSITINSNVDGTGSARSANPAPAISTTTSIKLIREDGVLYYSINGTERIELDRRTSPTFDLTTWFGAYPNKTDMAPKRFITVTMSNMYIKLEAEEPKDPEEIVEHNVMSDAIQSYYQNIDSWNTSKTALWNNLRDNFDSESHQCKMNSSPDLSPDWNQTTGEYYEYRYDKNNTGVNYCDRQEAYDTKTSGNINVYIVNEDKTIKGLADYVTTDNGKITNMIPGTLYKWESATDPTVYGYVKATGETRVITLPAARNVRDLGGLTGIDGHKVKYGRLIRGEAIAQNDISALEKLGVTTELDLRESDATVQMPEYIRKMTIHYNFKYNDSSAKTQSKYNYEWTRDSLITLMQAVINNKNVYFHCTQGSDRTGTIAYLVEAILGVDNETKDREYELSTFSGRPDRNRYYDHTTKTSTYNTTRKYVWMLDETNGMGLRDNSAVLDWFYQGSTDETADQQLIEDFRAAMLEGYGQ